MSSEFAVGNWDSEWGQRPTGRVFIEEVTGNRLERIKCPPREPTFLESRSDFDS